MFINRPGHRRVEVEVVRTFKFHNLYFAAVLIRSLYAALDVYGQALCLDFDPERFEQVGLYFV